MAAGLIEPSSPSCSLISTTTFITVISGVPGEPPVGRSGRGDGVPSAERLSDTAGDTGSPSSAAGFVGVPVAVSAALSMSSSMASFGSGSSRQSSRSSCE